jgi:hypothetical protein
MAAGTLPHPGTKYGPCVEACTHVDCANTRAMADTVCHRCKQRIGYDAAFYNVGGNLVHALCEERAAEQEAA